MDRDLERIEILYNMVVCLVISGKRVQLKTAFFSVEFYGKNDMFYAKTEDVNASGKYLHHVYDLVKFSMAKRILGAEIEVITDKKTFAVIK